MMNSSPGLPREDFNCAFGTHRLKKPIQLCQESFSTGLVKFLARVSSANPGWKFHEPGQKGRYMNLGACSLFEF